MRTVVLGKVVENVHDVNFNWKEIKDSNGEIKIVYTAKPI